MSLFHERQFLKSKAYTEIAADAGYSTGFYPQRKGWIIRDKWDRVVGWYYPENHRLWTNRKAIEPVTFSEAIQLLNKKGHPG